MPKCEDSAGISDVFAKSEGNEPKRGAEPREIVPMDTENVYAVWLFRLRKENRAKNCCIQRVYMLYCY